MPSHRSAGPDRNRLQPLQHVTPTAPMTGAAAPNVLRPGESKSTVEAVSLGEWTSNPFATRYAQPGRLAYIFSNDQTVDTLVGQLRSRRWYGQIVGPHGSGKTTLLQSLLPRLQSERPTALYALAAGSRELGPLVVGRSDAWRRGGLVVIDGYEQLPLHRRLYTLWQCRRRGVGLLVSCHRRVALPLLWQTRPSLAELRSVVGRLTLPGSSLVTDDDVRQAYDQHGPNLREALFALYDVYEMRRRSG